VVFDVVLFFCVVVLCYFCFFFFFFFFSSRRRHTRSYGDWSSDVCSSDLFRPSAVVSLYGVYDWQFRGSPYHAGFGQILERVIVEIGRASCREKWRSWWSAYD